MVLSGAVFIRYENVWPLVRIYRGGFLLIQFLFLLGINTYGWRQAGVNHVLIFEINPRNNLSHQHLFEVRMKKQRKQLFLLRNDLLSPPKNKLFLCNEERQLCFQIDNAFLRHAIGMNEIV